MTADKKKIGEILVANGTISEKTLQRALEKLKKENKKIGVALEDMEVVTGQEIAQALADQLGCEIVTDIAKYSFPPDLLKLISVDIAMRHLLFPLKKQGNKLCLAMADPTDMKIASNLSKNHDLEVVPFIATRWDIITAINKHYLGKDSKPDLRKTVLVVEDNYLINSEMEQLLSKEGYRVVSAKDGIEAFKKQQLWGQALKVSTWQGEFAGTSKLRSLTSLTPLPLPLPLPVRRRAAANSPVRSEIRNGKAARQTARSKNR